jgi:hypothetical protein
VYYGPGLSGKTTNLIRVHEAVDPALRGEMIVLDTEEDRTLFFDFFPLDLGEIQGFKVKLNLYTVPGQPFYEASRRLILEGMDGVIFVADSRTDRLEENLESFGRLQANLESFGLNWRACPTVLQYNKRDLQDLIAVGTLEKALDLNGVPVVEAVATQGTGVMETIRIASRLVIEKFGI